MNRFTSNSHTFCICAYGESPYLEECIASVVSQQEPTNAFVATSTPNEHIEALAKAYELPLHINDAESGLASDWNYALGCADTPLTTVVHQDDIYLPEYSTHMLAAFNDSKKPLIFFANYAEIRGNETVVDNPLLTTKRKMLSPLKGSAFKGSKFVRRRILSLGSAICCPSVSFCMPNLNTPIFEGNLKCNLDWQAWEGISKLEGDFLYDDEILMMHRIHEESETSNLIADNTRANEDLFMFEKFWPTPIAQMLNKVYGVSRDSNDL